MVKGPGLSVVGVGGFMVGWFLNVKDRVWKDSVVII